VVGPRRSGTGIHIDPLGTSAWNSVLEGKKHWIMFPPYTPKELYRCRTDHEASTWFVEIYPKLKEKNIKYVEIVQNAGETVYVPGGWAHVVMNLEFSIAITHNFCNHFNLDQVYLTARSNRPKLAEKLKRTLETFPEERKYRKLGKGLRLLKTVPYLDVSSSDPSSSSSESESDEDVICKCHNKVMVQGRLASILNLDD
jgi:histone arginine demethylase JMJD6